MSEAKERYYNFLEMRSGHFGGISPAVKNYIKELEKKNEDMFKVLTECSEYLLKNKQNQIGHRSILHRLIMDAISRISEEVSNELS